MDISDSEERRKAAAGQLIRKYYYQLTVGCGKKNCDNPNCASSGPTPSLSPNDAAAQAIQCVKAKTILCPLQTDSESDERATKEKVVEEEEEEAMEVCSEGDGGVGGVPAPGCSLAAGPSGLNVQAPPFCPRQSKANMFLTEDKLSSLLDSCQQSGDYSSLKQNLWDVFSSPDCLGGSWLLSTTTAMPSSTSTVCQAGATRRTKEELRALEGEKDVDSCEEEKPVEAVAENASAVCTVDIPGLRRSFDKLFSLDNSIFEAGLVNALVMLCSNLEMDLKVKPNVAKDVNFLNLYEIVLELPVIGYEAYLENVLTLVCRGVALLPVESQTALVRSWASHSPDKLKSMLENLQQILSLKVYTGTFTRDHLMNDDETIAGAVSVIKIIYYASLLGGAGSRRPDWDTAELQAMDTDTFSSIEMVGNASRKRYHDEISEQLQLSPLDVRAPLIPLEEFYNEPLNETIEMDRDFANWKMPGDYTEKPKFSFMSNPFILNPATKAQALYYDNRIMMYRERRMNLF